MFETVSGARKSIYLEMYIFQDKVEDFDFFNLLREKAKQGLRVKLIFDSFGSPDLTGSTVRELEEAGVEVLLLSDFIHRMHRKVLVVDEDIAFIGGVNLQQNSRFWNDIVVRMTGNSLVKKTVVSFAKSYASAGGRDPILLGKNNRISSAKADSWIVDHSPIRRKFYFKRIYKKYLNEAQNNIILTTPYFIPKRWLFNTLHKATARGVKVEILVPKNTDHFFIDRVNYFYIYKLSKLGVKFYMEEKMNHAKMIIIDNEKAMVGSPNLDFFSFDFNSEVGVFFKDSEAVSKLLEIVKEWKKDAVLFDYKIHKPKWFDYILSPIINLFSLFTRIFLD